jgi:hypothetical protein
MRIARPASLNLCGDVAEAFASVGTGACAAFSTASEVVFPGAVLGSDRRKGLETVR